MHSIVNTLPLNQPGLRATKGSRTWSTLHLVAKLPNHVRRQFPSKTYQSYGHSC